MTKHFLLLAMLLLISAAFSQTRPADLPYEVAPWPMGDTLKLPQYPELPTRAGVSGSVDIVILVKTDGTARLVDVLIEKPSDLGFRQEVERVVADWGFLPATKNGTPVDAYTYLRFEFKYAKSPMNSQELAIMAGPRQALLTRRAHHPLAMFVPLAVIYVPPKVKIDVSRP